MSENNDAVTTPSSVQAAMAAPRVLKPADGWVHLDLARLWQYRDLIRFFVIRDFQVRYRHTIIGFLWAVIKPLFAMVVFTIFFGGMAQMPSDGIPYYIFSFAGLVPWQLFSGALSTTASSILKQSNTISKVYFPRLVSPIATTLTGTIDFVIALVILLVMMALAGFLPGWPILAFPFFVLLALLAALAFGLWLAALAVQFRDVPHMAPILLQAWVFATPIPYPTSKVPVEWQPVYFLNPMVAVVDGIRWSLLGTDTMPTLSLAISVSVTAVVLITGLYYFRRIEGRFADLI